MLTEADISLVLSRFYDRVKADDLLGPVFAVVHDWDEHLNRLSEFWSSMMLTTGRYKGNPLSMHLAHAQRFQPQMFIRWLELWKLTTEELLVPQVAREMQARAKRIASRFSVIICGQELPSLEPQNIVTSAAPYRISSLFNEQTLPRALLSRHALKSGTWAVVRVEEGSIVYRDLEALSSTTLTPEMPGLVAPEVAHSLELTGPVQLRIEFYDRRPLDPHQN
ncbi:DUF1971 domain-containing protein [Endobacterium cereale]|uniref:DUF1971 domain-containing protein n=1 Tax=Endobacterium cereale TaxID=2663029 RepID=UPI002B479CC7|nr:DUF1971 domain-containing protein [Endobacterium cereale]MEB2848053.1 DUF1971 domain-containing protein [Endobacterium cereale]